MVLLVSVMFFLPFLLVFFGWIILAVLLFALFSRMGVLRVGGTRTYTYDSRRRRPRGDEYGAPPRQDDPPAAHDERGGWTEGEQVGEVIELPASVLRPDDEAE